MRISIFALVLTCACSYSAEQVGLLVEVDNIPSTADHLDVTVTDSTGTPKQYFPSFQPQSLDGGAATGCPTAACLLLSLAPPGQNGNVTVKVVAAIGGSGKTHDGDAQLAQGTVTGSYTMGPNPLQLQVSLAQNAIGVYATKCNPDGTCGTSLLCKNYGNTGETGVCTRVCTVQSDCPATSPAAVCAAFPGTTSNYCQWDCTAAGSTCPTGLTCKPAAGSGGKSYCTGI